MKQNMMNTLAQHSIKMSIVAIAITGVFSPAMADGYGLTQVNRTHLKLDKWECKRCKVSIDAQGSIGTGVAYNDGSDSHFGNSSGTDKDGILGHLDANVTLKSESGYRTEILADKLGYDNGSAALTTGKPGQYEVAFGYRGIANYDTDRAMTPYRVKSDAMILAEDWQTGATTGQMVSLTNSVKPAELMTQRDRFSLDAHYKGNFYKAELNYQHEVRSGQRAFSGNLLTNSAMLAQPIDDSIDNLGAKIYFNGDGWLAGIDTMISLYNNDHDALSWDSAFSPTFGAAYSGQSATAPDNKAYRIAGNAQFSDNGQQILMHSGFSRFTQEQTFLPATINGPSPDLPTANLDGQVDMIEMTIKYSGRITSELSLRASYDYKDRDNKTEVNDYPQVITDSYFAGTAANPDYDRTRQKAKLAAKYRFSRNVYLDVGYEYDHNNYSGLDRDTLHESSIYGRLHYRPSQSWSFGFKAKAQDRSGSEYKPVSRTDSPSNPLLRKTYLADRELQEYKLSANYTGSASFSASANLHISQQDYTDTQIGLTDVDTSGYDISGQYLINEDLSFNAFLNQDWRESEQASSSNFSTPNWYANADEQSTVVGLGMLYQNLLDKQLSLGVDYNYSDGQSDTEVTQGLTTPYGAYFSTSHNVNAFADYQMSESMGIRFDWIFEQYQDADWSNQGLSVDSIPNVLIFGDLSHDYNAHYFGVTLSYQL
ncbi:decaheme-associated outer membrane protein, MtrB/PioB family [Shewanella psychrophila]|uniref:Decaheme-associated outer membrane protein, MtrB/PioB family n=2 Tax=Shewanella psychrophila TaxID=225848 RepID=A0A1S6HNH8_9GAMM|nr:decaheme-associated outer membrane protein, MtrB/PioB family [Shewanella psychrophila]